MDKVLFQYIVVLISILIPLGIAIYHIAKPSPKRPQAEDQVRSEEKP